MRYNVLLNMCCIILKTTKYVSTNMYSENNSKSLFKYLLFEERNCTLYSY